jgi:hypothetical protein
MTIPVAPRPIAVAVPVAIPIPIGATAAVAVAVTVVTVPVPVAAPLALVTALVVALAMALVTGFVTVLVTALATGFVTVLVTALATGFVTVLVTALVTGFVTVLVTALSPLVTSLRSCFVKDHRVRPCCLLGCRRRTLRRRRLRCPTRRRVERSCRRSDAPLLVAIHHLDPHRPQRVTQSVRCGEIARSLGGVPLIEQLIDP